MGYTKPASPAAQPASHHRRWSARRIVTTVRNVSIEIGNSAWRYTTPGKNAAIARHPSARGAALSRRNQIHSTYTVATQNATANTIPVVSSENPSHVPTLIRYG